MLGIAIRYPIHDEFVVQSDAMLNAPGDPLFRTINPHQLE